MGNHEDMLINYVNAGHEIWFSNGADETIHSYRNSRDAFRDDLEWIKKLPLYYEDENFIYVHAGVDVNCPMEKQKRNTLLWVREPFIYSEKKYYKRVIFGHTPTVMLNGEYMPLYTMAGNINIDTGCVFGGNLTALIIEDGDIKEFYNVKKIENV